MGFFGRKTSQTGNEPPVLGRDIPWKEVTEKLCRARTFVEFAKDEGGEVKAFDRTTPYGILTVECEALSGEAVIWVTHRVDFLHLREAFQQRDEAQGEEVVVIPFPRNLTFFSPMLRVWLCRSGAFAKMLRPELIEPTEQGALEIAPIAEWKEGLQRSG